MKKTIFVIAVCSCLLLSGCSGVSQEEYSSMLSANSKLEADNSELQNECSDLESKYNSLLSERDSLKNENDDLNSKVQELGSKCESLSSDIEKITDELNSANSELSSEQQEPKSNSESSVSEEENSIVAEFSKKTIESLNFGTVFTESGSKWYIKDKSDNQFITYPEYLGYEINDSVALFIMNDIADLTVNHLPNKNSATITIFINEPDGSLICSAYILVLPSTSGEGQIYGIPLVFAGDYDYLNNSDATHIVQDLWVTE